MNIACRLLRWRGVLRALPIQTVCRQGRREKNYTRKLVMG